MDAWSCTGCTGRETPGNSRLLDHSESSSTRLATNSPPTLVLLAIDLFPSQPGFPYAATRVSLKIRSRRMADARNTRHLENPLQFVHVTVALVEHGPCKSRTRPYVGWNSAVYDATHQALIRTSFVSLLSGSLLSILHLRFSP